MAVSTKNMNLDKIVKKSTATPLDGLLGNLSNNSATENEIKVYNETDGTEKNISLDKIHSFRLHTFNVTENSDMDELIESIKNQGIILPLLVRPDEDGTYEIISGHRRAFAARKIGLESVPCKIVNVDQDTANIMMVDTNIARSTISISEKAKSYKLKYDSLNHRGIKIEGDAKSTAELMSRTANDSATTIKRYIKLNDLIEPMINRMDEGEIGLLSGVTLSFIDNEGQELINNYLQNNSLKITNKVATLLRKAYESDKLNEEYLYSLKPNKANNFTITFNEKAIEDLVPVEILSKPIDERIAIYRTAIEEYFK